jgi:hypothetical protein
MKPVSPVVPGEMWAEVEFAKNQPQYRNLPAIKISGGVVITRWALSWRERLRVLLGGSIWLRVHTFDNPLQPVLLQTTPPDLYLLEDESPGPKSSPIVVGDRMFG